MSMDNVRIKLIQDGWQSVVHAVIESRSFSQIADFYAGIFQQIIQFATQTARERNDRWFIMPTIQPSHDMYCHPLRATGA